jgi:hypothetical protein
MTQTVREVLGSVFAPELRERIFSEAIRRSKAPSVPEEAERARDFVEGPLFSTIEELSGAESAAAVLDGLEPILQMAGSHVRERADTTEVRHTQSTLPCPEPDDKPAVLIATLDRSGVGHVARALVGICEVHHVADVFDLMAGLESMGAALVVIDCCLPAVDPTTVATMSHLIPPDARVVLWGATERMQQDFVALAPAAKRWVSCTADATHEDLATLIRSLV